MLFLTFVVVFTSSGCLQLPRLATKNVLHPVSEQKQEMPASEVNPLSAKDVLEKQFFDHLEAREFAFIEAAADQARKKRERLPGGYWKLDSVYNGLMGMYAEYKGQKIKDEMWKNRIELLKQWKAEMPESITARVALAEARVSYGWFVRGNGYINSVSRADYESFGDQLNLADKELDDAVQLNAKCPRWYLQKMMIAMAQGRSHKAFDKIFDEAVKGEPDYLQAYLVKSEYLTPKWSGEDGEWEEFVDSLPSRLSTLKASDPDVIYLVVVANKMGDRSLPINWAMIAKDRTQKGFARIEEKYGMDNFRLNQYAYLSCLTMDLPNAQKAFERIGDQRDDEVWGPQVFNVMKKLAQEGPIALHGAQAPTS